MLNKGSSIHHKLYEKAVYRIANLPHVMIQPGLKSPSIDELLHRYQVGSGAIITPYNPKSTQLTAEQNEARLLTLKNQLLKLGLPYLDSVSSDQQGEWLEYGVLVLGIDLIKACEIGREYRQNAVIYMQSNAAPEVIWIQ